MMGALAPVQIAPLRACPRANRVASVQARPSLAAAARVAPSQRAAGRFARGPGICRAEGEGAGTGAPGGNGGNDDEDDGPPMSRREIIRNVLFIGVGGYIASDLVQDLGFSVGENAESVPEYEGVQGVGTKYKVATFAGGCFWCMEPAFDDLGPGVKATVSGYTGGSKRNPSYREVSGGRTGHYEAVQVVYDPELVTYDQLLDAFWHNVNPTQADGQFVDIGPQYRTGIFVYDDEQKAAALASKSALDATGIFRRPVVTQVKKAETFWPAELYHQNYYLKNSARYGMYRSLSGRDDFIQTAYGPEYVKKH